MIKSFTKQQLDLMNANNAIIKEKTKEKRAETSGKPKDGSVTISGFFGKLQPELKSKKAGGKPPPRRCDIVIRDIEKLAKNTESKDYRVDSPNQISIPLRDQKALTSINKQIKAEKDPQKLEELTALYKKEYENIKGYISLYNGKTISVSTFVVGNLDDIKPYQKITCIQIVGDYSESNGVVYTGLNCKQVFQLHTDHSVFVRMASAFNLEQLPFNLKDETHLVYFADYHRDHLEDGDSNHLGPVKSQAFVDFSEDNCRFQREGEPTKMKLDMTLWQKQDTEGYCIMGTLWDQVKDSNLCKINKCFGIDDVTLFGKIMESNKISAIAICSMNHQKTPPNQEKVHDKTVSVYLNEPYFFLREYLLQCGLRISFQLVKELLCDDKDIPDKQTYIQLDNPEKPCQLNSSNIKKGGILINDKVINVSSYSGKLYDLEQQGVEWRVLHGNSPYNPMERITDGQLAIHQAEEIVRKSQYKVIYAVIPMSTEELKLNMDPSLVSNTNSEDEPVVAATAATTPKRKVNEESANDVEEEEEPAPIDVKEETPKKKAKTKSTKSKK